MARPKRRASEFYSTEEVVKIARVSYRKLQYWDEQRIIPVKHNGHVREWTPDDLSEVILIADLRKKGLSLQKTRSAIQSYRRIKPDFSVKAFYVLVDPLAKLGYLNVKVTSSVDEVIELFVKAKRPMILSVIQNVSKEKAAA